MKKLFLIIILISSLIPCFGQDNFADLVEQIKSAVPPETFVINGNTLKINPHPFKVMDVTDEGCRVAFFDDNHMLNLDTDCFLRGFNGYSDRTYKMNHFYVKSDDITYKTISGTSRTIPSYRNATDEEIKIFNGRLEKIIDLNKQAEFNATNRIVYLTEHQAMYDITNKIKLPKGYVVFVTNSTSTNSFSAYTFQTLGVTNYLR